MLRVSKFVICATGMVKLSLILQKSVNRHSGVVGEMRSKTNHHHQNRRRRRRRRRRNNS